MRFYEASRVGFGYYGISLGLHGTLVGLTYTSMGLLGLRVASIMLSQVTLMVINGSLGPFLAS